ncbi:PHD-finger protein [Medicago truncatula]|uniref:PHD-finger protein n=1 Tax=Medicago truncatula TaxID=3880 RepID=A0A072V3A7_MEDTR|nr:PHD-finger protein [Medicago truncatula]
MTSPSTLQSKKRQRESEEGTTITTTISSSPLQSKDRPRESEETDKSTSSKVSKASSSGSVKKATLTTVSRSTSKENEKHVSQSESEVSNSVDSGKRGKVLKREGIRGKCSQLIKDGVLVSGTIVFCRGKDNVKFTLTKFEAHACCTKPRPSKSIFLQDRTSLLDLDRRMKALSSANQKGNDCNAEAKSEAANSYVVEKKSQENNNTCSVCGFGGDLILCDGCPSSFHSDCLGPNRDPDGMWLCPSCCCRICCQPKCKQEFANDIDDDILACVQCERKFHFGERKLTVALGVLRESFGETIDPLSKKDLIEDVVFSRSSEEKRLNFRGFYTVIIEKGGKVSYVATVRIYGQKVAEIVFMATKKKYRRQGMCCLLMKGLEEQLINLGVGSLVLHSSKDAIDTWKKSFHFVEMTNEDKCKFVHYTFFEFQDTIMCLKSLNKESVLSH